MVLILHSKPLSAWAKEKLTKYQYQCNLNVKQIEYSLLKDFNPLKKYDLIVPLDEPSLRAVTSQTSMFEAVGYLIQETSTVSCPVIPSYHPYEGMKDPSRFLFIKKAFTNVYRYLTKDFDPVPNLLISNNIDEINSYLKECEAASEVCIDLETTYDVSKVSPFTGQWKDVITAVGISKDEDEAMCFSRENLPNAVFNTFIDRVVKINANPKIDKVGQNYVMFDAQVLYFWKVSQAGRGPDNLIQHNEKFLPAGRLWDTMHMFNILYPKEKSRRARGFSKGLLEQIRLFTMSDIHKDGSFSKRGIDLRRYCALDVVQTYRIRNLQLKEFAERGMTGYYEKFRLPLGEAIVRRQILGLTVDKGTLGLLKVTAEKEAAELRSDMHAQFQKYVPMKEETGQRDYMGDRRVDIDPNWNFPTDLGTLRRKDLDTLLLKAGVVKTKAAAAKYFVAKKQHQKKNPHYVLGALYQKARSVALVNQTLNPNSPIQLRGLFEAMGQKLPRNSTDHTAIQTLLIKKNTKEVARDFCRYLLRFRKVSKFVSTYCNVPLDLDGKLRGNFNVDANDTGRSACRQTMWKTGCNLQTLPSHYVEVQLEDED